jgi:hypothetical protein
MEQIEIILIIIVVLAIIFKIIKMFKQFVIIFLIIIGLKSAGVFENSYVVKYDKKYEISQTFIKWNKDLELSGTIQGYIDYIKNKMFNKKEYFNKSQCLIDYKGKQDKCK